MEIAVKKAVSIGQQSIRACSPGVNMPLSLFAGITEWSLTTKGGQLHIDWGAVADAAKYDGKWVIETNDDTKESPGGTPGYRICKLTARKRNKNGTSHSPRDTVLS